jgi:transcriptional regulator with XRE-family HTH domain
MVRLWIAQLKAARKLRRLSQGEVGARMGTSGQAIWKWEAGLNRPSVERLAAWAETVGFDLQMVPTPRQQHEMEKQ